MVIAEVTRGWGLGRSRQQMAFEPRGQMQRAAVNSPRASFTMMQTSLWAVRNCAASASATCNAKWRVV